MRHRETEEFVPVILSSFSVKDSSISSEKQRASAQSLPTDVVLNVDALSQQQRMFLEQLGSNATLLAVQVSGIEKCEEDGEAYYQVAGDCKNLLMWKERPGGDSNFMDLIFKV